MFENGLRDPLGPGASVPAPPGRPHEFGRLISQTIVSENETYYHHYDALGSTAVLTDGDEVVTDEYAYEAFGETAAESGPTPNPHLWVAETGYRKDEETGLYDLRRRKYSPQTGRFASEDPIRDGEENLYRYVGNRTIVETDPSGLEQWINLQKSKIEDDNGSPDTRERLRRAGYLPQSEVEPFYLQNQKVLDPYSPTSIASPEERKFREFEAEKTRRREEQLAEDREQRAEEVLRTAASGVPTIPSERKGGPDVTRWFATDLIRMMKIYKQAEDQINIFGDPTGAAGRMQRLELFSDFAKYYMAHKWINFGEPKTGVESGTITVGGHVLRKNQLGNIMFGFFLAMMGSDEAAIGIKHAYTNIVGVYPVFGQHPHAGDNGAFQGFARSDNLAAFALGVELAHRFKNTPGIETQTPEQASQSVETHLRDILSLYNTNPAEFTRIISKFSHLNPHVKNGRTAFTENTLFFIPYDGGFNTNSLVPSNIPYRGPGTMYHFRRIAEYYQGLHPGKGIGSSHFDEWLKLVLEDYYRDRPHPIDYLQD